jgi:putative transposase
MEEKKIKGRKRHIAVDTLGNLLSVTVHAANIHDTISGPEIFTKIYQKYPTLKAFSADAGYCGTSFDFVNNSLQLPLLISKKIADGFQVLPKRWIVERTLAWINNCRRLSKDFEINEHSESNFVRLSMLQLTLRKTIYQN